MPPFAPAPPLSILFITLFYIRGTSVLPISPFLLSPFNSSPRRVLSPPLSSSPPLCQHGRPQQQQLTRLLLPQTPLHQGPPLLQRSPHPLLLLPSPLPLQIQPALPLPIPQSLPIQIARAPPITSDLVSSPPAHGPATRTTGRTLRWRRLRARAAASTQLRRRTAASTRRTRTTTKSIYVRSGRIRGGALPARPRAGLHLAHLPLRHPRLLLFRARRGGGVVPAAPPRPSTTPAARARGGAAAHAG